MNKHFTTASTIVLSISPSLLQIHYIKNKKVCKSKNIPRIQLHCLVYPISDHFLAKRANFTNKNKQPFPPKKCGKERRKKIEQISDLSTLPSNSLKVPLINNIGGVAAGRYLAKYSTPTHSHAHTFCGIFMLLICSLTYLTFIFCANTAWLVFQF